ncbi:UvrD-helicase domain-containing protein [Anaerovorax odorimutans]|uniref:DNA 3'-5' helicase n=1 Tax=Anaerovorax odorimutans TaxID=109327 RepID=A0ABT1RP63_9FIRM|nr:UvrD-helicase domain-containing protein [Anaerovorax odorimutans]MCQ4636701.1 UvrD-helicase domain-containing protein [Anaerovorax odorimutans]
MYIADLHIHSKYSRATSRECVPEHLDLWARRKGIDILGTGDFTHPAWRQELKEKLSPAEEGLYVLKDEYRIRDAITSDEKRPRFILSGEISSIYKQGEKTRKVHNLILLPSLEDAEHLSRRLEAIGNIHSDGRPILGLSSRDLLEIALEVCPRTVFIPAHIWTPHFSLFGAFSGFDTIEECFGDLTGHIHALETGLSSDPPMNWRLSALDGYNLVSNSDAHSPAKLGREANLLDIPLSYEGISNAIQKGEGLSGTIEFFPEEGKYHMDGHRKCDLCLSPVETSEYGGKCPVCGKKITIGVLHRVEQLADRGEDYRKSQGGYFESLVPLPEVIAASTDKSPASVKVQRQYEAMLKDLGTEFSILRELPLEDIGKSAGPCIEEGIRRLRQGKVERIPGYDGEYGKIKIIGKEEIEELCGQMSLFGSCPLPAGEKPKKKRAARPLPQEAPEPKTEPAPEAQETNPQQKAAAEAEESKVAVIAGPGTGKTYTLVERIAFLIDRKEQNPSDITAVTFTNKAAGEMRLRLMERLGPDKGRGVRVGTFHAICLDMLKKAGKPVSLAEEQLQLQLAAQTAEACSLTLSPAKLLRKVSQHKAGIGIDDKKLLDACEDYSSRLKNAGFLDFDDLLLEVLRLTGESPQLPDFFPGKHLLVDELQDINDIQFQLILAWSRRAESLFVIGDPDQSIYGFRGADPGVFQRISQAYPETKRIRLDRNYRSTPQIIDCALPVIENNSGERRILTACAADGEKPRIITAESRMSEAICIAREINRMTGGMDMMDAQNFAGSRETHRSFGDIAVLYRTHHQAKLLEKCLKKESIPCVITGREPFLQDPAVRAAILFFRCLPEPEVYEEQMQTACREIFKTDLKETCQYLKELFLPEMKREKPQSLLRKWAEKTGLSNHEPLSRLADMAVFYNEMGPFLDELLLGEEQDLRRSASGKRYDSGAVTLMTLHAAKGLEFPVVFLCGVNEDCIPMKHADMEEERRLFYVGLTRAREELILLTSEEPSPFIDEMPKGCLRREEAFKKKSAPQAEQLKLFDF